MAYTPPAGNAADFSWQGASAYTAPSGSAANFTFQQGATASVATGFSSTAFGSPTHKRAQAASGFTSTNVGTPTNARAQAASGFSSTALGTPTTKLTQAATSVASTNLGQPTNRRSQAASGFLSTQLGAPVLKVTQTGTASGFTGTQLGTPYTITRATASGFAGTAFGAPTAPHTTAGVQSTVFGTPVQMYMTAASPVTSFGPSLLARDDFSSGSTTDRAYQTALGTDTWKSVDGTISGGLLNPVSNEWNTDYTYLEFSATSLVRSLGHYFDITVGVRAVDSVERQEVEAYFVQGAGTDYYNIDFVTNRRDTGGLGAASLSEYDNTGIANNALVESPARTKFAVGTDHVYRYVNRPGQLEIYEDGVLLNTLATQAPNKQSLPYDNYAYIMTYGFAVDYVEVNDLYGTPVSLAQFGTPSRNTIGAATSLGPTSVVPQAYYTFNQTTGGMGFISTGFGEPLRYVAPTFEKYGASVGAMTTVFGTPVCTGAIAQAATGVATGTTFGTPTARRTQGTVSFAQTVMGSPALRLHAYPVGFRGTLLGSPGTKRGYPVTSIATVRFGKPRAKQPNSHVARGVRLGNFGRPKVSAPLHSYKVAGWTTTYVGAPVCFNKLKVRHLAPTCRFGSPTARRLVC